MKNFFNLALGISTPWYIVDVRFDATAKRLDIAKIVKTNW